MTSGLLSYLSLWPANLHLNTLNFTRSRLSIAVFVVIMVSLPLCRLPRTLRGRDPVSRVETAHRPIVTLALLPPEILTMILVELEWRDVLMARKTCRALYRASKSRPVWTTVYQRIYSDYDHPLPFGRDVHAMPSNTLEAYVTDWLRVDVGWLSKDKQPRQRILPRDDDTWYHLVEGGRWLLASSFKHGCVYAYDLDATDNAKSVLIRPEDTLELFGVTGMSVQVTRVAPRLEFHLVLIRDAYTQPHPARLTVWKLVGVEHDPRSRLSCSRVASFNTHQNHVTRGHALWDDFVAVGAGAGMVSIYDWKKSSFLAPCISRVFPPNGIYDDLCLLPGQRLLVMFSDRATIFAVPDCCFQATQSTASIPILNITIPGFLRGLSSPYCDEAGKVGVLFGGWDGIYQLVLPPERTADPSVLLIAHLGDDPHCYAIGTHRAFITSGGLVGFGPQQATTVSLRQPGVGGTSFGIKQPWSIKRDSSFTPLIDEGTGRIVELSEDGYIVIVDYIA